MDSGDGRTKLPPDLFCLCVKDIMNLIKKSEATARRKLKEVRDALGRDVGQPVFLSEYCAFHGYPLLRACAFFGLTNTQLSTAMDQPAA